MASWCRLNVLMQRLRCSQNQVLDTILKSYTPICPKRSGTKSTKNVTFWTIKELYFHTRMLHTSCNRLGKRGPSGVARKRTPLKVNQGIKLDRTKVRADMTISELAVAMQKSTDHIYEVLMIIPGTESYDCDSAVLNASLVVEIVKKSGMVPEFVGREKKDEDTDQDVPRQPAPDPASLVRRPPVVTIMGHVDHGKTTLLDQLRNSNIVDKEFGGITQHIGAFLVELQSGESICFLDTPGHAAFSAMRGRGAMLTDIVVLVVSADDGVMQQTLESIQHAQDAMVPIIVAINKIDKSNADVQRTKQMLLEHQVQLEEFGGEIQAVPISALKGTNILELQEAIVTQAELMDLKGDPSGLVEGRVVEARVDDKRGRLVTAVIQRGTLQRGNLLIAGTSWAKVRAMFDEFGNPIKSAPPGTPVEILGWKETPSAGDEMLQVKKESSLKAALAWRKSQKLKTKQDEDQASIEEKRKDHEEEYRAALIQRRLQGLHRKRRGKKPSLKESEDDSDDPRFSLVLKGDVDGSVDAILDVLDTYDSKKCQLDIIHFGVGNVAESDIEMAAAFDGEVFAFNVSIPEKVSALAKAKGVPVNRHNIIYRMFEDLVNGMNSKLPKIEEDDVKGEAKVLQVFQVTMPNKTKMCVAGSRCVHGTITKKFNIKVVRNNNMVYQGAISSLKHFKDETESVKKEQECGISVDDPDFFFEPQDLIICYDVKEIDQEIDWNPGF